MPLLLISLLSAAFAALCQPAVAWSSLYLVVERITCRNPLSKSLKFGGPEVSKQSNLFTAACCFVIPPPLCLDVYCLVSYSLVHIQSRLWSCPFVGRLQQRTGALHLRLPMFVCPEMATKGLEAKTVGLKVKTVSFQVRTLDSTGQTYVSSADELYSTAAALLQREIRGAPGGRLRLRLMGVKASGFRGQAGAPILPGQATLDGFLVTPSKTEKNEAVVTEEEKGAEHGRCKRAETGQEVAAEAVAAAGAEAAAKRAKVGPTRRSPQPAALAQGFELWGVQSAAAGSQGAVTVATSATAATESTSITCPVCGEDLGAASNAALNRHVDACLGVCPPAGEGGSASSRKRAKVSATGIERFLTLKGRT